MDEAVDAEAISVGRTLIERRTARYARILRRYECLAHEGTGCPKLYSVGVYTGLSKGASGILFPDNGHQGLAVENGKDTK